MQKTIAIVGKHFAPGISKSLTEISDFLKRRGHFVVLEAGTAHNIKLLIPSATLFQIGKKADVVIIVGGDGTMLGIARQLAPYSVPLIGINHGRLGFITDISLEKMLPVLGEMLDGKVESEKRSLLQGSIIRDEKHISSALAFNDIVVMRGAGSGMAELVVEVDYRFMYRQRSDGLIVSTPTGSTAYALSAGGPLLHPSLKGIVLVPIAPHALSNRPIVIPDSSRIVIEIVNGREMSVNFDMQSLVKLRHGDRILVQRSEHTITFLHPDGWSYYDTLRRKLYWNEQPSRENNQFK